MRTVLFGHTDYCALGSRLTKNELLQGQKFALDLNTLPVGYRDGVTLPESFAYTQFQFECPTFCHHYNYNEPMFINELYGRMIMHPICSKPAMVPACTFQNEQMCVRERILKVRNNNKNTRSGSMTCRAKQFASLISEHISSVTGRDTFEPYSEAMVLEAMPRRDRAAYFKDDGFISRLKLYSFQKREAYSSIKAPRNISPVEPDYVINLSKFTYPLNVLLHETNLGWYMPGLKPCEVGDAVARVTKQPYFGADYSKFDGRQNRDLRSITKRVFNKLLNEEDARQFNCWFNRECNLDAVTAHGVKYSVEGTMVSGSPLTTIGNTLLNGFLYYRAIAHYLSKHPERCTPGLPLHQQAWHILNTEVICYGDDSLGPAWLEETFMNLTNSVGIAVTREDTSAGATFLGRVYLYDGQPYSIADIRRVFPKMHITTLTCDINQAACNKAIGLRSANPQEWWITKICKYIERHHGSLKFNELVEHSEYFFKRREFGTYPEWPPDFEDRAITVMAGWCGLTVDQFLDHIDFYDDDEPVIDPWVLNGVHCRDKDNEIYIFDSYCWDHAQHPLGSSSLVIQPCPCNKPHSIVEW